MTTILRLSLIVLLGLVTPVNAADKPGPFASADTKLDYLLSTWEGRTREELGTVWGGEASTGSRGNNTLYVFEQTSKVRAGASILTGQVSVSTGSITCIATFEVDNTDAIVRVTRRGGGKECWNAFKKREPPK